MDRQGRFVAGTMHMNLPPRETPLGGLYRLAHDDRVTRLADGIVTANAPCFSPDDRMLYLADRPRQVIWRFDYDTDEGLSSNRRIFGLAPLGTAPDGVIMDTEGHLWSAQVRRGEIVHFDPADRLMPHIRMPASHPTNVGFGGAALDVLFATSISRSRRLTAPEPEPGGLFAVAGLAKPLAEI